MARAWDRPACTGDLHADAVRALRWAMAGEGLTLGKLAVMDAVLDLPAVAEATAAVPRERRLAAAYDVVVEAARALGGSLHARILRNALGVDYAGEAKDLTSRRTEFAVRHNEVIAAAGRTDFMAQTARGLYEIEQRMLVTLVTALRAPREAGAAAANGRAVGGAAHSPAGPWELAVYDQTLRLAGRTAREIEMLTIIRSCVDGLDWCRAAYGWSRDDGPPAELVVREGGAVVEDRDAGRRGSRVATIQLARVLRLGQTHRLRFDIRYGDHEETEPWLVSQIVRVTEKFTSRVAFDRAALPDRVWRLDAVLPAELTGRPSSGEPLYPDRFGCVETSFDDPAIAWCYGIGWAW